MSNIIVGKKQTKVLAQAIYGEVKSYCLDNFDRYFPWWIDDMRKTKGLLSIKPFVTSYLPCPHCGRILTAQINPMKSSLQKKQAQV